MVEKGERMINETRERKRTKGEEGEIKAVMASWISELTLTAQLTPRGPRLSSGRATSAVAAAVTGRSSREEANVGKVLERLVAWKWFLRS